MARTTLKVAPAASRVFRKSAIVASLCAAMLVAGMLHPTHAYGDTLSDAQKALTAAQKELTAANNALTAANNAFASLKTSKSTIDKVNSATAITSDVVFSGQTPLYAPVSGNTGKPANSTLVAVEGKYVDGNSAGYTQQQILNYINSVRKDAYNTKLANGDRVASSYKAITWSKNLERTAQIRATEISIYGDHTRPSGEAWYGVSDEGLMQGSAENLSWGASYYNNIKMWVDEKADYIKYLNCSKGKKTVNGVNQCSYGVYGHYRNLVNPQYDKVGLAQFNSDRSTVNPYSTAMAAEFSASANTQSSAVKAVNTTVYQGVYVKSAAMGSVGTAGATTFSPSKVSGDPVWTRSAQVKEAKTLAKSMASKEWSRIQSDYNTKQAAVTAAQKQVTTAQKKVDAALDKYVAAGGTATMSGTTVKTSWKRLEGAVALDTMKAVVNEEISSGVVKSGGTVVIATDAKFKDALAGNGIAGVYNAPILFTNPNKLSVQTKNLLTTLKPKQILIMGSKYAIADSVLKEMKAATGVAPKRLEGPTAVDTANAIAKAGKGKWTSKEAIVVTDQGYKDALSIGPYAYAKHAPIFYAKGAKTLTDSTLATMKELGITKVHIIGSVYAIPASVEKQITSKGMSVDRIGGKDAIETSQKCAEFSIKQGMSVNRMGIATTTSYKDGLAAGPLLGRNNAVLVLTNSKNLSAIDAIYGKNKGKISKGYIFGSKYAVADNVYNHVNK